MKDIHLYIQIAEMMSGVCFLTLAVFFRCTQGNKGTNEPVRYAEYFFELSYVSIALALLGLCFISKDWTLDVRLLLLRVLSPFQSFLLFWMMALPVYALRRKIFFLMAWQMVYVFVSVAVAVGAFYVDTHWFPVCYSAVMTVYLVHLSIFSVKTFRIYREKQSDVSSCSRLLLVASWVGIYVIMFLFVVINLFPTPHTMFVFVVLSTVFYFVYAVSYYNYNKMSVAVKVSFVRSRRSSDFSGSEMTNDDKIRLKLQEWVGGKGYLKSGVTINDLCKELGINRTYLSHYINETFSCNFNCWINRLRIEEAQGIMKHSPGTSLSEVAELVGFADISHFSKKFKAITGEPPSAYGKRLKNS